ncbi:hypothetical protein QQF64_034974 [Cirrhinus molitorella]|uniref:Uncharacterized protein n=1 Tax=Cirrhinus molitorella TaxID=172907 RepID=A0ABR3NEG0_9TELE
MPPPASSFIRLCVFLVQTLSSWLLIIQTFTQGSVPRPECRLVETDIKNDLIFNVVNATLSNYTKSSSQQAM